MKLKPCRFCNSDKISLMSVGTCWCECSNCKARGPISLFPETAEELWCSEPSERGMKYNGKELNFYSRSFKDAP
jgi:hypothetical protein